MKANRKKGSHLEREWNIKNPSGKIVKRSGINMRSQDRSMERRYAIDTDLLRAPPAQPVVDETRKTQRNQLRNQRQKVTTWLKNIRQADEHNRRAQRSMDVKARRKKLREQKTAA